MQSEKQDQLFRLIKSMTKSEKRYFKRYATFHSIGEVNKYVVLFDAIDELESYDKVVVQKKIKNKVSKESFNVAKNYLFETILKSLKSYEADSTVRLQIKELIHSAQILFKKGIYDVSEKVFFRAEHMALEYGMNDLLIEIYEWNLNLMQSNSLKKINHASADNIKNKQFNALKQIKKSVRYNQLNTTFYIKQLKTRFVRSESEIKEVYSAILTDPLVKNEQNAATVNDKLYLYSMLLLYYGIINNYEKALEYALKELQLFNEYPKLLKEKKSTYLVILFNCILYADKLKNYSLIEKTLHQLKKTEVKTIHEEKLKFVYTHLHQLNLYIKTFKFEKALAFVPEIEKGLQNTNWKINEVHFSYFNYYISILYFLTEQYPKVILQMDKIIQNPINNVIIDIQAFARILNLIAQYELKNWEKMPSLIVSTYRFLIKKERLFEFEKIFIKYLKKLQNTNLSDNLKPLLVNFKNEISFLQKDPYEVRIYEYFDFTSWLESKIENKPLKEVLKKNTLNVN